MIYRLHKEGKSYIISTSFFLLVSLIFVFISSTVIAILVLSLSSFLLVLFLIFFRNPHRVTRMQGSDSIFAPADGKVVVVEKNKESEYLDSEAIQISIFMSPMNVHINRSPIEGDLVYQKYHPGQYLVAWHPKSSELNERNTLVFKQDGNLVLVRQIAGKVARKIVSYLNVGDHIQAGQEFGFIKFGSRVDIFLPVDAIVSVKIGDKTVGGMTEIGKFVS